MQKIALAIGVTVMAGLGGCATSGRQTMTASARCDDIRFPIYFVEQSDALTAPALQALTLSAQQARVCPVRNVAVTGLDDGDAQADLSRRRAATVVAALTAQGLPKPDVELKQGLFSRIRLSRTRTAGTMTPRSVATWRRTSVMRSRSSPPCFGSASRIRP